MNGSEMMALVRDLYPLCRSLTGDGVRETLKRIQRLIPLEIREVPSGSPALDWTVPLEWNVREAWIRTTTGQTIVDLKDSTLHVVGYSTPIHATITRTNLDSHLHSLPEDPDWIPWRTSYYSESWGFCMPHRLRQTLTDAEYEVFIDSTLAPGHLSYGELLLPGTTEQELLVSVHVCHPSLANDNLSGIAVATAVAMLHRDQPRQLGIRFLFIPGTIGSLTWLELNRPNLILIVGGLTLTCLGDAANLTYKRTFDGRCAIDRAALHVLEAEGKSHELLDFYPYGYDERQYNSPGFRLPIGSLMRSRHGRFREYHTSADDLSLVSGDQLEEAAHVVSSILSLMDRDRCYVSLAPEGEPQLGRRGIYRAVGGGGDPEALQYAMLWLLQAGDGRHTLLDVAERSGIAFSVMAEAADILETHALIAWSDPDEGTALRPSRSSR